MAGRSLGFRLQHSRVVEAIRVRSFRALLPLYRLMLNRARSPDQLKWAAELAIPGGSNQKRTEFASFMRFVGDQRPVWMCEIGVCDGGTNVLLSRMSPTVKHVVGIDTGLRHKPMLHALTPPGNNLHLIEGRSLDASTVERVSQALDGNQLDVLFIDGSHAYEDVRGDFLRYRAFVRPGGIIAFHDIMDDRGVAPGEGSTLVGGVPMFWREVRARFEHREFVADVQQSCYGIGALIHDPAAQLPPSWTDSAPLGRPTASETNSGARQQ